MKPRDVKSIESIMQVIFSDSHCHLDQYHNDHLSEVLLRAEKSHVGLIVTMGMSVNSSAKTVQMAIARKNVYAAIGIHPFFSLQPNDDVMNRLRELARNESVVAIGEVGLDYFRKPETRELQKELLRCELSLAREMDLPVSIHCREAHHDIMSILEGEVRMGLKGWIHSFMAGPAELKEWLDLGFYVAPSFRATVYNGDIAFQKVVRLIPEDRLLTETDSANTKDAGGPHDVVTVVQRLAEIRGTSVEHVADITAKNLKRLLNISDR